MSVNPLERLLVEALEQQRSQYFGKYAGVVSEIEDPDNRGRLKAQVPDVYGEQILSPWALPCTPYCGDGMGFYQIPPVGTGVWIEFVGGDINRPIWSGCRWDDNNRLPENEQGERATPELKIIRTESGMMLSINDENHELSLSDQDGNNILKIESRSGKVTLQAGAKVVVEAASIELVENARHPVVFGDDLLNYLNSVVQTFATHMHPGETCLGIPCTPMVPAQPLPIPMQSMLSQKVKSG